MAREQNGRWEHGTAQLASAKGGCGKTTLSILLGAELAMEGYTVALLDCDLNQHAAAFGKKMKLKGLKIVPSVAEQNVLAEMRNAELEMTWSLSTCLAVRRPSR